MFEEYTARLVTFHTLQGSKIISHNWVLVIFLWCSFILSLLIHHLLVNLSMNFTLHVQDTDNFAMPNAISIDLCRIIFPSGAGLTFRVPFNIVLWNLSMSRNANANILWSLRCPLFHQNLTWAP